MKPLSVEMACLLGIQNEIQAVWEYLPESTSHRWLSEIRSPLMERAKVNKIAKDVFIVSEFVSEWMIWSKVMEWPDLKTWFWGKAGVLKVGWVGYNQYASLKQPKLCWHHDTYYRKVASSRPVYYSKVIGQRPKVTVHKDHISPS